ncbi:DUF6603 domain-containing protein [Actinomadura scrupuli]|uniref:DUF6603 domain-containing protein n=1 Tax=Actinomadura scrupuli TaxID=559629 RepID=UPI003D99B39D
MTPDELSNAVALTGTRVDVPVDALPGAGSLFTGFFPGGHVVIDPVTSRTETTDGVTVTGTGASGPFTGMTVTMRFAIVSAAVTVFARAAGDTNWTFTKAFPDLRTSVFDTLRFQSPELVLDSTAATMTFTGTLIITTPLAPLDLLMPGVTHAVTGEITTTSGPPGLSFPTSTVPDILLYGPEGASLNLGLFTLSDLRYEILADPFFDYDAIDFTVQCSMMITGTVPITVAGVRHEVLLYTEIRGWGESLMFVADFSELGDLSLSDVASFAGQSALPVPFDFDITSPVRLTEVRMLVTPSALSVAFISLKLQTRESWTVVPRLVELQAIDVTFRIDAPGPSARLSGTVDGLVGIGEVGTLQLTADFGTGTFGGDLRGTDGPLGFREVYTHFTGADPSPVPDLAVSKLDFGLTIPGGGRALAYDGFIELIGDWKLTDQVSLTNVMFSMEHTDKTRFEALAIFVIQRVNVKVTAGYDPAPDRQWEFSGATGPGQQIAIGSLLQTLAARFGSITLPAPIARLVIENLGIEISTGAKRLFVTGEALFPIDTVQADLTVAIDTARRALAASLTVTVPTPRGPFTPRFDVRFARQQDATLFAATYSRPATDPVPRLKDLVGALLPSAAGYVPDGLAVDLRAAFLAVDGSTYVFGADLALTVDLSRLPVAGAHLKLGEMGFDPLRMVAVSALLPTAKVKAVNDVLPTTIAKLPERDLTAGFVVDGRLKLGSLEQPLVLPVSEGTPPAPTASPGTQTADNTLWYKVQRTFGPLHIERAGLAYLHPPGQEAVLAVLLDASLTVAGLTLSLDGLQVRVVVSDPGTVPSFGLNGLGVSYTSGPVEISGSFLKSSVSFNGVSYPAYSGQAVLRAKQLTIGAIGSYIQLPQGPSLFVYAFLNYPIGGPAFFFVRGLAAGFGYNRRLIPPSLDKLADFPLVADALGRPSPDSLAGKLQRLQEALPPSPGDFFLMAGIRFTSFQMIESFLLLAVSFGHRFEMNLLGLSTLVLPAAGAGAAGVTPIAEVQLALRATLVPDDGVFSITAQLTPNSYLLSRNCHLTGGFAFAGWFSGEHAGDFVLTVGGYHPRFTRPGHYPVVPRLGLNWQVTPKLQVSGGAYYALTPSALMAGGNLSATYRDDSLRAWFNASMDFLIAWQPYQYEAAVHILVGASYTFSFFGTHTITAHVGADVTFSGPNFGGRAYIDLSIISFTISFGTGGSGKPQPIPWSRFRDTLLPAREQITTVALRGGSLVPGTGEDLGVVEPHGLALVTDSVVPSTSAERGPATGGTALPRGRTAGSFGISPLGLASASATHRIEITNGGRRMDHLFGYEPVGKKLPYALWGGELETSVRHPQLVGDLLTGYTVRPLPPTEPAAAATLPGAALSSLTPLFTERNAFAWAAAQPYVPSGTDEATRAGAITGGLADGGLAATRAALRDAVLPDAEIDLTGVTAGLFHEIPQVAEHG